MPLSPRLAPIVYLVDELPRTRNGKVLRRQPMVSAYFKNVGQTRTLIQLLQEHSHIQQVSGEEMKEKFARYNLELQEVLIGTPTSAAEDKNIETILGPESTNDRPRDPQAEALHEQIRDAVTMRPAGNGSTPRA